LKPQEVVRLETTPHPVEFDMYYSVWRRGERGPRPDRSALHASHAEFDRHLYKL
jgi:hypothetical protein